MKTASRPTRLATVLGWPLAIGLVSWRYLWRTTPLHRSEEEGSTADLPSGWDTDKGLGERGQGIAAGVGPLLHRCYTVWIVHSPMDPATLMTAVGVNLNRVSPEMAVFRKTRGASGPPRPGDEFVVRMPGPWDGPVRVVSQDSTSFRLATLDGHLEAGQIEFRAAQDGDALRFEIESWARAGDRLSHLLYNRLRLAKEIQLNMWSHFCVRTAALARGRPRGGVTIHTRRLDWPPQTTTNQSGQAPLQPEGKIHSARPREHAYTASAASGLRCEVKSAHVHDQRKECIVPREHTPGFYPFAFASSFGFVLRAIGVRPDTSGLRVDDDKLEVWFGPWRLVTPLSNISGAELSGPYRAWKVLGARLSLADRGLTFGTNTVAGACIRFHRPVAGIEPTGLLRHPALTVTLAEPHLLVERLRRQPGTGVSAPG